MSIMLSVWWAKNGVFNNEDTTTYLLIWQVQTNDILSWQNIIGILLSEAKEQQSTSDFDSHTWCKTALGQ